MITNIGVLLYPNVQAMDVIGPWEVLSFWKMISKIPIHLFLIAQNDSLVACDNQITLTPHCDFAHSPKLDCLIVPGGRGRLEQVNNDELISFIKRQTIQCQYILSVCTGMFLLQKAGLLDGKSATTYWRALPELRLFKQVNVVEERIVKNGKLWTAGGISSGIDLALELIADVAGKEVAGQVQLLFEYFPKTTMYCEKNTVNTLPPYNGHEVDSLPEYIQMQILNK